MALLHSAKERIGVLVRPPFGLCVGTVSCITQDFHVYLFYWINVKFCDWLRLLKFTNFE